MTEQRVQSEKGRRLWWLRWVVPFGIVAAILVLTPGALNLGALADLNFKTPDIRPLLAQSVLVQFHVWTVAIALLLGPVQFLMPKGTTAHRVIGWVWVSCMLATAIATLFIRDMRDGAFSPIHIFSLMTLIGVPMAIWAARSGNVRAHTSAMIGTYIGLVIAGVTAIAPGRVIWEMFFQ